jgi:putative hydrolase of the HAD superfamily
MPVPSKTYSSSSLLCDAVERSRVTAAISLINWTLIKAVIFDLGRVIVPFDFRRAYARLEALTGISASEIANRIGPTGLVNRFEAGQINPRDFVAQYSAILNLNCTYEDFCEIWNSIFLPETLVREELLRGIAGRYRLILLSNTNAIHIDALRRNYPLLRHFHAFVLSHEVGAMKPSPLIYERAVAAAGCLPGECFFTDDIAEYAEAAKGFGLDAVQFQSAEQIEAELRQRISWD